MMLIPYEKIKVASPLSIDEVANKIASCTRDKKVASNPSHPPADPHFISEEVTNPDAFKFARIIFEGKAKPDGFKVVRIISGRNSFRPEINGTYTIDGDKTIVDIQLMPNIFTLAFMGIWYLVYAFMFPSGWGERIVVLALMFFFITISFKSESKNSRESVIKVLEGDII
jgi:hypothetical protein